MIENLVDKHDLRPNVFHKTPEGYLTGRVCVTGAGVFSYETENGTIRRLRPIDEVLKMDSIETLNGKPVTLRHPNEEVTPENAQKLSVGMSSTDAGSSPYSDYIGQDKSINLYVTLTVTDKKAIQAIEAGELEAISCGYSADIQGESGVWQGVEYDEVMTNIRYNHIALVKRGRAGDAVNFRVADGIEIQIKKENEMQHLKIGDSEFEVPEEVKQAFDSLEEAKTVAEQAAESAKAEAESAKADAESAKNEADAAKDALNAEIAKANDEAEISRRVKEYLAVADVAKTAGVELNDSADEMKRSVISKVYPSISLDGKNGEYVEALFDAAKVSLKDEKKVSPLSAGFTKVSDESDTEKAYQKMCATLSAK